MRRLLRRTIPGLLSNAREKGTEQREKIYWLGDALGIEAGQGIVPLSVVVAGGPVVDGISDVFVHFW